MKYSAFQFILNDYGSSFDENTHKCAEDFRGRMSAAEYERIMSIRSRMNGRFGRNAFGRGFGGRSFDPRERDEAPEDMPGAERFDPDYDGSMPERPTIKSQ